MGRSSKFVLIGCAALLGACSSPATSEQNQPVAVLGLTPTGRVVDAADKIDARTELELTSDLESLERATGDQLVVVTVPSLQGRSIEQVGLELGRGWRIGQAQLDNGVLLLVAPRERKVRIEVGYGLEGLLTDARAAAIIRNMLPRFTGGNMDKGIRTGADEIRQVLLRDRERPRYRNETRKRLAA